MLEVSSQAAVLGLDRPAVLGLGDLAVVLADHGLDGDGHAGDETGAAALMAVVRHFGVFVQLPAGAVAHELADDGEAGVLAVALDGIADVADAVAGHSLLDALIERGLGDVQQALSFQVDLSHCIGAGVVAVEAIDLCAGINAHDVTRADDDVMRRDTMDDGIVQTDTGRSGETVQPETGRPTVRFSFRIKAFYHELETAVSLTAKMMYQSDLANEKRLLEIIGETRSQLYERLKSAGHNTSIKRASSYHSESGYLNEIMTGISFYEFLNDLYDHFEERKGMIIEKLRAVSHQLFNKRALLVSFTADKEGYDVLEKAMDTLIKQMPDEPFVKADWNMPLEKKNEGICCASQIQFVGRTGNYKDAGLPFRGSLLVLQNILNYDYLWIRLRVKGGAYGCMSGFGRDGDCYMVSYLDPKLAETNEVYDKLPDYLEQFDQDERSMDRYVIGAISEMDIPKNPAALGVRGLTAYLSGITREQLQKERDEVIDTDAKEIRALVPYAKAVLSNNCLCVVGNENKIKENSSLFTTVRSL